MSEQTTTGTRPAGTSALIYGVIAIAVGVVLTPVTAVLMLPLGVIGAAGTLLAGVVVLVVGIVQRLAGGVESDPRVGRTVLVALGPALTLALVNLVLFR